MANIVFNVALGRVREYYDRVNNNDPSTSALVLTPLETSGLESDANLRDSDNVAEVVDGATNKQTTMGEKVLTDSDLAASAQDDVNDRLDLALPTTIWSGATGNPISKILVSYRPDTGAASDSTDIPLTMFDFVATPDGSDIQMTGGTFLRATSAA